MKEREPDFEDEKIRAWLIRPSLDAPVDKEQDLEGLEKDSTVITIDEETEEIFESRKPLLTKASAHARWSQRTAAAD